MSTLYGNAVVGQSGGPTVAINATLSGVIRGAGEARRAGVIGSLYGMRNGIEGLLREELVELLPLDGDEGALSDLERTPAAALGSCRKKLPADPADALYDTLFDIFARHRIRYFFYIGGNDSMDTVSKLSRASQLRQYEMRVIGIPKTVDNDLAGTDHTPGFGSAAKYIATTVSEIICDCAVYTVPAVTIVEVMGRDAGWMTAAAALSRVNGGEGPDYLYLPERPMTLSGFLDDIRTAHKRHPNVVIAVSEGVRDKSGVYVGAMGHSGSVDAFGHQYLAGTARVLTDLVKSEIGCKTRSIELNLQQRCASHLASLTDLRESVGVGRAAVNVAVNGESGKMMAIRLNEGDCYGVHYDCEDVHTIANRIKTVPDDFITDSGNQVTDACLAYLLPLIAGEAYPRYENGLPVQFRLK